jgi:hypothetical protein
MDEGMMVNVTFQELDLIQQIQILKETCRLFKQDNDPEMFKQVLAMVEEINMPELIPGFNTIQGEA